MLRARKIVVATATFAVALGTGFLMQYSDALAGRGEDSTAPPVLALGSTVPAGIQPSLPTAPRPDAAPEVARLIILAGSSRPQAVQPPSETPDRLMQIAIDTPMSDIDGRQAPTVTACAPGLAAEAMPGALVRLVLDATCHPASPVTVHHAGMIFSATTDDAGRATFDVPALATPAMMLVDVMGQGAMATVEVPDLAEYDRAVLQWQGETRIGIHALEDGATYGADGHVWSGAPGSLEGLLAGRGGTLVSLGEAAAPMQLFAEVYTFPSGLSGRSEIALNVEAEVTRDTCGKPIAAQTIQIAPGTSAAALDLSMTLPGCEAAGEFLVLSNMLRDLTLASR